MADLPLLALVKDDLQPNAFAGTAVKLQIRRQTIHHAHTRRRRFALRNFYTLAQLLQHMGRRQRLDQCKVGFGMLKGGMRQPMRQFAIVGKQHKPLTVQVEPTHGKNAPHIRRQQVGYRLVLACVAADIADDIARLVHLDIDVLVGHAQRFPIDHNVNLCRVYLYADLGYGASANLHQTVDNHLFACSATAKTGRRHYLVQAFFRHEYFFLLALDAYCVPAERFCG
jgi:hypothetical protein